MNEDEIRGEIQYARGVECSLVTVTIPDAWLELREDEFAWRVEQAFDRMRDTFNEIYLKKRERR